MRNELGACVIIVALLAHAHSPSTLTAEHGEFEARMGKFGDDPLIEQIYHLVAHI